MKLDFEIDTCEVEHRKQQIRDVWAYRKVDHIPIMMSIRANPWGYTVTEQMINMEKQLEVALAGVKLSWERIPDDYIPAMRPDVGCIVLASAFGAEVIYGEHPDQTPYIKGPVLDDVEDVDDLELPDPTVDGLMPEGLRRIKYFAEETDHRIYLSLLDMGGPMNAAMDLLGSTRFFTAMYDFPEAFRRLLDLLTETFILFADVSIEAAGGIDFITCTDFPDIWSPEGHKGHVSDDTCAAYSPEFFRRFSMPVNNKIFAKYGGGMLHNCGPNPAADDYLWHTPRIYAVDLSYRCSRGDLTKLKSAFAHEGVIYFGFEGPLETALNDYKHVMEVMTPDVIVIPCVELSPDDDANYAYNEFLKISREYALRMDWSKRSSNGRRPEKPKFEDVRGQ
ncbi:MAG: hypothetical protein HPY71_10400 [Firmicutes bacterium]|nr:hypothetical protein [Bacillota bacterium]